MSFLLDNKKIELNNMTDISSNITCIIEEMDLTKLSKTELLEKCEELGIKKCKSKNKGELISLINVETQIQPKKKVELIIEEEEEYNDNVAEDDTETIDENIAVCKGIFPVPQYLGSKTKYIDYILKYIPSDVESVLDAFSGSGIVSYNLKKNGYKVISNDILSYNSIITKALVENSNVILTEEDIDKLFEPNLHKNNFIETEFTDLYYTKDECMFLDNLYSNIQELDNEYKKALAFASIGRTLIRKILFAYFCYTKAMDYRKEEKHWKRNPVINSDIKKLYRNYIIEYNNAVINNGKENLSYNGDILLTNSNSINVDLVYLDPPYGGTHSDYANYYHFLETYINYWKDEPLFNKTKQPKNKLQKSEFATKNNVLVFEKLFEKIKHIKYWMISYNSNATPNKEEFVKIIKKYKNNIQIQEIKLHNNNGGMGLRKDSKEYLFICY
jgi:adenine-specific DNA methylase